MASNSASDSVSRALVASSKINMPGCAYGWAIAMHGADHLIKSLPFHLPLYSHRKLHDEIVGIGATAAATMSHTLHWLNRKQYCRIVPLNNTVPAALSPAVI